MNIKIVCVGKLKEKYLKDAAAEYEKRLSRFCKLKTVELADENDSNSETALKKEGERIMSAISDKDYVVSLCIEGKQLSSSLLAENIRQLGITGFSDLCFVIGGSLGICDEVKARSNFRLSFSEMTFPHQLMRIILLEQIYRSFKINAKESYHK